MSRDSSIRSAARATFFAPRQIPIRWRLAGGSALLTLIILCAFAGVVGALISERLHEDFEDEVASEAERLGANIRIDRIVSTYATGQLELVEFEPDLNEYAAPNSAIIRILSAGGARLESTDRDRDFGLPRRDSEEIDGYQVETRPIALAQVSSGNRLLLQYARPVDDVEATIQLVRLFLVIGVLSGAGLALLAGLAVARRAMAPIAQLTATAREIERTRDPAQHVPTVEADDEVAELSRTLADMLAALDEARAETEATLARQREFVADASHELRTPLTSVLANLEILADHLEGEPREAARSALRSSQRMRRLVADLLLLARADAARKAPHGPTDVAEVLVEAAAELGAVSDAHELSIDAEPAVVQGARDELHRLALNLMENAIRHTPAGTHISASVVQQGDTVRLVVEDDGPGIPAELRDRVFERFVRGSGDRGGSFGLGLSIVRAVADSHGGTVELRTPTATGNGDASGTRFEVSFPAVAAAPEPDPAPLTA